MISAVLFYLTWLASVFLLAGIATALHKVWMSLYALSHLDNHTYVVISHTAFDDLHTIKHICDRHGISYTMIYFGRLCGRAINRIKGEC